MTLVWYISIDDGMAHTFEELGNIYYRLYYAKKQFAICKTMDIVHYVFSFLMMAILKSNYRTVLADSTPIYGN